MPYEEIKNVILEVNEALLTESMVQVSKARSAQEFFPLGLHHLYVKPSAACQSCMGTYQRLHKPNQGRCGAAKSHYMCSTE